MLTALTTDVTNDVTGEDRRYDLAGGMAYATDSAALRHGHDARAQCARTGTNLTRKLNALPADLTRTSIVWAA